MNYSGIWLLLSGIYIAPSLNADTSFSIGVGFFIAAFVVAFLEGRKKL